MRCTVVGLGKIGLPLAVQIASKGHMVHGADISQEVIEQVNGCVPPFPGEADLGERLRAVVREGSLTATTDTAAAVSNSEVVIVVVPLIVDEHSVPDFTIIDSASQDVGRGLRPGTLVSYETTLPVGTTRDRFVPMLAETSGLTVGGDLFVCHSPERVFSGRVFADLRQYPKLVGGVDAESSRRAVSFYESALDFDERVELLRPNGVWNLQSAEAAEFAKLAETTYRDVNIGLANEFASFAERVGLDVYAVIEAANSQPFSHVHRPGIAVGGHCIPVYPRFYLSNDPEARVPSAARAVNEAMPENAVERLRREIGDLEGLTIAVLGLAYRGGVKEAAFSGALSLVRSLEQHSALAVVHDPLYTDAELERYGLVPYRLGDACAAAIIQADHEEYRNLAPSDLPGIKMLLDGRAWVDAKAWKSVRRLVLGVSSDLTCEGP